MAAETVVVVDVVSADKGEAAKLKDISLPNGI